MSDEIYTEYRNQIAQMSLAAQHAYFRYVSDISEHLANKYDDEFHRLNKLYRDNYTKLCFSNSVDIVYRELAELKYARDYYRKVYRICDRYCLNM